MVKTFLKYDASLKKRDHINTALKTAINEGKDRFVSLLLECGTFKESTTNKATINECWELAAHLPTHEGMSANSIFRILKSYSERKGISIPSEVVFTAGSFATAELMMADGYYPLRSRNRLFHNAVFRGSMKTMTMLLAPSPMLLQGH